MKLRTHPDGSIWTRDGKMLWYYPNSEDVQQQESPPIQDIYDWDAHTGKYSKVSKFKVIPEPVDERCQVNEVCIDGVCVQVDKNFLDSDLVMTAERTHVLRVLDASASWVVFDRDWLHEGDVLTHANNNCIEILDEGKLKIGHGYKYHFVAKPAVHSDALRAGEKWTLIKKAER